MNTSRTYLALAPLLLLAGHAPATSSAQDEAPHPAPEIGRVAPELGSVVWRQLPGERPPVIADLRGKVIVVQTWVWFCDS